MEKQRSGPSGTASSVAFSTVAEEGKTRLPLQLEPGSDDRACLAHMLRVMYPHTKIGDGPYQRAAEAVMKTACERPGSRVAFLAALHELKTGGFTKLDDAAALELLRGMAGTDFFTQVQGSALLVFYDDPEVWEALGYEGPSFDKGGYVDRGFNDLDWLPEPRVDYEGGRK